MPQPSTLCCRWALTPAKANRRQQDAGGGGGGGQGGGGSGSGGGEEDAAAAAAAAEDTTSGSLANADAERTLLRIKQKLEGVEGSESGVVREPHVTGGGGLQCRHVCH